jgi:hypothetical protein
MSPEAELRRVAGEVGGETPASYLVEEIGYPGDREVLDRAREVMTAVLTGDELPAWFVELCIDDTTIQTCELKSWSLRAWKFWLLPENRRWWWWSVDLAGEEIRFRALVHSKPYLRGSLDWLFKASASA